MQLTTDKIIYRGETLPGNLLDNVVIVSVESDNKFYRIIFSKHGNLVNNRSLVDRISDHFGFQFEPGKLDGNYCFINEYY